MVHEPKCHIRCLKSYQLGLEPKEEVIERGAKRLLLSNDILQVADVVSVQFPT